jgi:hypothetical protein
MLQSVLGKVRFQETAETKKGENGENGKFLHRKRAAVIMLLTGAFPRDLFSVSYPDTKLRIPTASL